MNGVIATTCMAAAIWASPSAIIGSIDSTDFSNNMIVNEVRSASVADAKEMASASGSRVNKDPESLLRYGLPIPKDKEV